MNADGPCDRDDMYLLAECPQHTVYLDAYWIDKFEVTNSQYERCIKAGVCGTPQSADNSDLNSPSYPVVGVGWNDAVAYCQWAGARLPTEAEWEKAARGTDGRRFPWGNNPAPCDLAVTYDQFANACDQGYTIWPVGSKPAGASPYGALDMAGNAQEWVMDWYDADYYTNSPSQNPAGPNSGNTRVQRGGSWLQILLHARTAHRDGCPPDLTADFVGFRCVVSGGNGD